MKGKNQYIGKSASYLIASNLLLRGYNIAIPEVDVGIDVVAIRSANEKQISVQMKSSKRARPTGAAVTFSIPIQENIIKNKVVDFFIFSLYMPITLGLKSPHARWWNVVFPIDLIYGLCSGNNPIGSITQNNGRPNRTIYFSYDFKLNKITVTRPSARGNYNHHEDISSYCDGIYSCVWDEYFPEIS